MNVSINIAEALYRQARDIADAQHLAVDDVISSAFAEQLAAWKRLKQRAARGRKEKFFSVLDKVPDVDAEEYDHL